MGNNTEMHLEKESMRMWTGFIWLRIGSSGGMCEDWTFGFCIRPKYSLTI
jgi:hypothetical protein